MPLASQINYLIRSSARPAAKQQKLLGPWDSNDPGGDVHTVCPPEQVIPINPTKSWWRGDFGGITTPLTPPFVDGANTTPANMWMSFFLPKYQGLSMSNGQDCIDYYLTATAERSYSHVHLDVNTAMAVGWTVKQFVQLVQYLISWEFFVSFWGYNTNNWKSWNDAKLDLQPLLDELKSAGSSTSEKCILLVTEEENSHCSVEGLFDVTKNIMPQATDLGLDVYHHFTSNYPAWPLPGQTQQQFWQEQIALGVKGLCWQSNAFDPAGTMGGHMWDSRKVIPPPGRLVAFETRAYAQLVDPTLKYTEEVGCLTGLEMIYCTRTPGSNILAVAGSGNGLRYRDGTPV